MQSKDRAGADMPGGDQVRLTCEGNYINAGTCCTPVLVRPRGHGHRSGAVKARQGADEADGDSGT